MPNMFGIVDRWLGKTALLGAFAFFGSVLASEPEM